MKIHGKKICRKSAGCLAAARRSESGSITFIFIALLSIMVILVAVNGKTLSRLHREVKFLEHQQIKRLNPPPTNSVAISKPDAK